MVTSSSILDFVADVQLLLVPFIAPGVKAPREHRT